MDISVHHATEADRFELRVNGELAAYADTRHLSDGVVEMPHTYTLPSFRGQGLAAQVVRAALDNLAADGHQVLPTCWFVAEFIDANPQYGHLLASNR
ncbi:MAG TPA: N-acetyltransferase [Acidimicrobiaceae bacterium]|nr:N-acetyltransferase [Acidimicrobiaceae bacterium]